MKLDWRRILLYMTVIGIEASWLYGFMAFLNKQVTRELLSMWGLLPLYPLALGINRLLPRKWPRGYLYGVSGIAWMAATLLTVKWQLFRACRSWKHLAPGGAARLRRSYLYL